MKQLVKYLFVGVLNTGLTSLVMFLFRKAGLHYTIYTALGYGVGFINSFILNGLWTFRRDKLHVVLFARFLAVNLGLFLGVQAVQIILIEGMHLPELPAIVIGMVFYTGTGFLLNRILFRPAQV